MGFGQVMPVTAAGSELEQAQAAYGRAFNRFGLGHSADREQILDEAETALGHLRAACPDAARPGLAFIVARIGDTGALLDTLRAIPDVGRIDIATGLLAVDFLLRAVHAQHDHHVAPAACINCRSTHLVPRDGGTAEAPLYQCTDCGLTAAYPGG